MRLKLLFKIYKKASHAFCILIYILSAQNIFAQQHYGNIKGSIVGADGTPAANITVQLIRLHRVTVTDNKGNFILQHLPALNDTLSISSVDSKPLMFAVQLSVNGSLCTGTIKLHYFINQLQSIEINGRISKSYKSDYSFFGDKTKTSVIRSTFQFHSKYRLQVFEVSF